jgi:hypothetical protein
MDRQQARQLIQEIFQNPFDRERYQHFLHNFLNKIEPGSRGGKHYTGNLIPESFRQHVNQYWCLGKYIDPDGRELDLLVVEIKTFSKLERARSALRNFAIDRLKQFEKEASLIAFYAHDDKGADWRFSFVKIEHEAYKDEKGKVKIKQELTPARRYSFLVGVHENSHTACKQLLPVLEMDYADPRIEGIEAAFSIEKITDEFFDQYKALFQKLAIHLKKQKWFKRATEDETDQAISRFAKKLLGQIVFLYFLQKKGWLGAAKDNAWGQGSRKFLRDRYNLTANSGGDYYRDFLQYLFYEALACERRNQNDSGYYKRFQCRIPFLNGGLFEADYDWQNVVIEIPNSMFHNAEKTKAGDAGTGILDVFDRYNFTIKEDEPLDKEVAVDPEMLGKVFENMLEITERKAKGAFYTPREIVHYMCQESLIHYLDNVLNSYSNSTQESVNTQDMLFGNSGGQEKIAENNICVPQTDLETLIRKGHLALENDTRVISKGKETKDYKFQLPEAVRLQAKAIDSALAAIKVCDPAIGSGAFPVGLLHEIVNARLALAPHSGNSQSSYELKRHAIAESIYGVDLDASAIDIARLRLWLSLIVDEDDYGTIAALPNLDYKIVQGDSLLGIEVDLFNKHLFDDIEKKKKEFFGTTDHDKKSKLASKINALIHELSHNSELFDFKVYFSEVWHQRGGFDVVIGNPPYVQIQHFSGKQIQREWEKQKYESFVKTGDIYCLFYEKGHRLLRNSGTLAFITSNKWMRAAYGEKLRKFFLEKVAINQLIDFGDSPIFSEATTYTNILLFEKNEPNRKTKVWDLSRTYRKATSLNLMLEENSTATSLFGADGFLIASPKMAAIKKRIEEIGTPLKDWDISINYGIKTGFNEAFIVDDEKKNEMIAADPKSAEVIKPILRGRDIKRYQIDFADLWLINTHTGFNDVPPIDVKKFPVIRAHLDKYWEKLKNRQDKGVTPYNLRNCAYYEEFTKEKIVWLEMSPEPNFAFSNTEIFVLNTSYILTGKHLKWLLPILNSEIMNCYFPMISTDVRGKTRRYIKQYVELLPIVPRQEAFAKPLELLVDYLELTQKMDQKLQSAYFEEIIDGLVYELYFPDEIKSVKMEIYPHLGELTPITDKMTDEEKLAIIRHEFDRLYDTWHPVRNHVETLDSIDIVRTIRKALNRK